MNALRNLLNIPLRVIKLIVLFLAIVFLFIVFLLFSLFIDPIIWILTGKYKTPDERWDILLDKVGPDKIISINTQNK